MTTAVIYEANGKILTIRSGNERSVLVDAENSGKSYLITDEDASLDDHYVSVANSAIKKYPEKPAEGYVFNYSTEAWEFDLALAREKKWLQIKAARTAKEFNVFDWDGYAFQCDEVSQMRIQAAVQAAIIDDGLNMVWTLADNSTQTFSAAEIKQIGQALANHVNTCHERGRILRAEIQAATTQEELEAITW